MPMMNDMRKRLFNRFPAMLVLWGLSLQAGSAQTGLTQAIVIDTSATAPVIVDAETVFVVRATIRGMSITDRTGRIAQRIVQCAESYTILSTDIDYAHQPDATAIYAKDQFIMGVYDVDGEMEGMGRDSLAGQFVLQIRTAVDRYREARSAQSLVLGGLQVLGATAVYVALLFVLARIVRKVRRWMLRGEEEAPGEARKIVRLDWIQAVLLVPIKLLRWAIVLVLSYVYLGFVLALFPWTRPIAVRLLDFVIDPLRTFWEGFVEYLPSLFFLLVLILIVRFLLRGLRKMFLEVASGKLTLPGFYADWADPTYKIVRVLVIAFAIVVAFPYIPGSGSPAFQGISIFAGVLFSLGSTSAISNMVAGIILTYMRGYKVGEVVQIGETRGLVTAQTLLITRIRTPKNVEVTIPNANVLGTHVTNYSVMATAGKLILPTTVTIGYQTPWRQVHSLLRQAAARTPDVLQDPAPFVLQQSLNDFYVTYELNVATNQADRIIRIYSDLHKNIQDAFNEHGVEIMSPNYEADRDRPTFVPRENWYAPPAPKPGEPGADS